MIVFKLYIVAIVWALVLILPLILFFIFLRILQMYALRSTAIDSETICNSLREGWHLFRNKLKETLLIWLISIGLGLLIGIAMAIIYLVVLIIFLAIGFGLYTAAGTMSVIIISIILGLIFLAVTIVVSGFVHSFISAFWTLAFVELKNK